MFDSFIPITLILYGICLTAIFLFPTVARFKLFFGATLLLRFINVGMRISIGSDIFYYTQLLNDCNTSSINSIEIFWNLACLPSHWLSNTLPFPFLLVGFLDTFLFFILLKVGGWRVAALYDLIYLPSTSMGAIRQALAMKIIFISVIFYLKNSQKYSVKNSLALMALPFVHLASAIPIFFLFLTRSKIYCVVTIIMFVITFYVLEAPKFIDDVLYNKISFYVSFEGFREEWDLFFSWIKRLCVIAIGFFFTKPNGYVWLLYLIGLFCASFEPLVPEIAVRIGAYFQQFEILILLAPLRYKSHKYSILLYTCLISFYFGRFIFNSNRLPWEA